MSWFSGSNSYTRRDREFEEKCKDDAVNKSIPIIDETDPTYFPYTEESLPIPIVIEETKKIRKRQKHPQEINIVTYIQNMPKKEKQILEKQIRVIAQKKKKKKKLQ